MTITLTTTDNQKNNDKNDTSSKVDIGPCEDILRTVYNISKEKKNIIYEENRYCTRTYENTKNRI